MLIYWFSSNISIESRLLHQSLVFVKSQPFQLMVNCWFGARWFGFLGSPYERDCYLRVPPESQTTGPQINNKPLPSLKLTVRTWKWMVGVLLSLWDCLFSGAFTVSFRECSWPLESEKCSTLTTRTALRKYVGPGKGVTWFPWGRWWDWKRKKLFVILYGLFIFSLHRLDGLRDRNGGSTHYYTDWMIEKTITLNQCLLQRGMYCTR